MADAFKPVGPCVLLLGDPTTTAGADMVNLGDTENVNVDFGVRSAYTSSSRRVGVAHYDSIYALPPIPVINAEHKDAGVDNLLQLVFNSTQTSTDDWGGGDSFALISAANVHALALIPDSQSSSPSAAKNQIWLPAATTSGLNGLQFGRVDEGEINQPFTVEYRGAWRDSDHDATSIPAGYRILAIGPLSQWMSTWSLPASI